MAFKFVVFAALWAFTSAGVISGYHHPVVAAGPVVANTVVDTEYDPHPQYSYAYDVQDSLTGDFKSQVETRDGDVVQGQYSLVDPDGTKRTVDYAADPINGFNAVVSKTPIVGHHAVATHAVAAPAVTTHHVAAGPVVASAPAVVDARVVAAPAYTTHAVAAPAIATTHAIAAPGVATHAVSTHTIAHTPFAYAAPTAYAAAAPTAYAAAAPSVSYFSPAHVSRIAAHHSPYAAASVHYGGFPVHHGLGYASGLVHHSDASLIHHAVHHASAPLAVHHAGIIGHTVA